MKAGSCLHELPGTGCEAGSLAKRGKLEKGPLAITQSRRLGWDIQEVHVGTGWASPACLGPPNLGGWMGFAEAGNRHQLFRGSRVRTNSAMAWRGGDRADLSDLVPAGSGGGIGHVREHGVVAFRNLVGLGGDRVGVNRARRT